MTGVLRCFAVESVRRIELTPLDNAIEAMTSSSQEIENLIRKQVKNPSNQNLENLRRKVHGMVDAAVMGGVKNYEKVCSEIKVYSESFIIRFYILIIVLSF